MAKDSTKDRGICIEPLGNLFCQLGIGGFLKQRLASTGIFVGGNPKLSPLEALRSRDRPEGQTIHRDLARDGSRTGGLVTIDLSSASDTVATELVRDLLPPTWFQLLDATRSKRTLIGDRVVLLEKFSSMGNGFTFELETLIFCGLIHGVTGLEAGVDYWVYGDDIIVPASVARDTLAVLQAFGFQPNHRKTFVQGPFRESCGGDFFLGHDVRAFFLKEDFVHPCEWYVVYNELSRRGLNRAARVVLDCIPNRERRFGPARLGHSVLWSHNRELWDIRRVRSSSRDDRPTDGILWVRGRELQPFVFTLDRWSDELLFALSTYGIRSDGVSPRGEVVGMRTVWMSVS